MCVHCMEIDWIRNKWTDTIDLLGIENVADLSRCIFDSLCAIQLLKHECQSDHFRNGSHHDVRLPYVVSRTRLSLFDVHWLTQYVRSNEVWKFHIPFEWLKCHANSYGNAHSERRLKNHMNYKNWRIIMYWFVSCWFWQTHLTGSEWVRDSDREKKAEEK